MNKKNNAVESSGLLILTKEAFVWNAEGLVLTRR